MVEQVSPLVSTGKLGSVRAPKGSVVEVNIAVKPSQDVCIEGWIQGNQQGFDALRSGKVVQVNITPAE